VSDPGPPAQPAAEDEPTLLIPRLTRSQRQRASRKHSFPLGWILYSLVVAGVVVGAAFLAVRG
jgi:hypothetical protein